LDIDKNKKKRKKEKKKEMCFNQPMSGFFVVLGLSVAAWVWKQTKNVPMVVGIIYFVLMEALQFVQYFWLDDCDDSINQFLTVIGFLHICFQPYFTHLMNGAFVRSPKSRHQFELIRRLAVLQGLWMFSRYVFAYRTPGAGDGRDWLRSDRLCTIDGGIHLGWELPLHAPSYWMPSNSIHLFMMFFPFLCYPRSWVSGLILLITGPVLSALITDSMFVQASVWCFMSISQITLLVVVLKLRLGSRFSDQKDVAEPKKSIKSN
jgi:Family of unknown function (DUF5765)